MTFRSPNSHNKRFVSASELVNKEEESLKKILGSVQSGEPHKLILVGDGAVGKTSMVQKFLGKAITGNYLPTIGCQFNLSSVSLSALQEPVRVQIWDLAGQPYFHEVRKPFYGKTDAAIIVGDLSNPSSFESFPNWISEIQKNTFSKTPILLAGNKVDLLEENQSSLYATKITNLLSSLRTTIPKMFDKDPIYLYTSAITGFNIKEVFQLATIKILIEKSTSKKEEN